MILGSDSHTRYGALGTLAIGEGGPELVKQLLGRTYDIDYPRVIAVRLTGSVRKGVGPQDVALALIGKVFESGFVKNAILEFIGEGIDKLSVEYRNGDYRKRVPQLGVAYRREGAQVFIRLRQRVRL